MEEIKRSVAYGKNEISYELLISDRKSFEVSVFPDGRILVKSPSFLSLEDIDLLFKKKMRWVKKQISYFKQFNLKTPSRKYIGGESHLYLGRKYRLKINYGLKDKVLLKNGYFMIDTISKDPGHIKKLLDNWYEDKLNNYLLNLYDGIWSRFNKKGGYEKPVLKFRKMNKRWGSLSSDGKLNLNPRLIQAPKECIEYVIIHELCHLIHHNHSPDFYFLLDRLVPDWKRIKHKLELSLI